MVADVSGRSRFVTLTNYNFDGLSFVFGNIHICILIVSFSVNLLREGHMHAYLWSYINTHACAIGATEAPLD